MKVAYFSPNEFHNLFLPHVEGTEFLVNQCDRTVNFVYAASLSTLEEAGCAANAYRKPLVAWVWDIPRDQNARWSDTPPWRDKYLEGVERVEGDAPKNMEALTYWVDPGRCSLVLCGNMHVRQQLKSRKIDAGYMPFYIDQDTLNGIRRDDNSFFEIVQVSRLAPHKNFECAIEALAHGGADIARETNKIVRLTTIGYTTRDKHYIENLVRHAKEHFNGLPVTARFVSNATRATVVTVLAQADVFVSASLHEGFGVPAAEAAHVGVPLLLADRPYYTKQYGIGVRFFDPDDPGDLARGLLHAARGRLNVPPALAHLEPESFAKRWQALINEWAAATMTNK